MKHPNKEKLEKYAVRQISADEMTAVILHLENCADCFGMVQKLLNAENQGVLLFTENETDAFHLEYDEHLRPFVDNEVDAATREIVESHTQICSNCAFQLRELREFSESLRLREIEQKSDIFVKINGWIHQISHHLTFKIALPLLAIIAGIAAIIWLSETKNQKNSEEISLTNNINAENQSVPESNQNSLIAQIFNQNSESQNQTKLNVNTSQNTANREIKNDSTKVLDNISTELNDLPANLRETIRNVLQTSKLKFPSFLPALRESINLRGKKNKKLIKLYPNGEAVQETSPIFSWEEVSSQNQSYVVEIFDENNDSIEVSQPLTKKLWTPKAVLQRGKIYQWEIRITNSEVPQNTRIYSGKFKVLDQKTVDDLAGFNGKSPLVRGVALASAGLLTMAENEFRQAIKENQANQAKIFLQQIRK